MPFTYILYSQKYNKTYTGSTVDLENRLKEHNSGKSLFTSKYMPWIILHSEEFKTINEARKKEKYYKSAAGRKNIKKLFNHIPL